MVTLSKIKEIVTREVLAELTKNDKKRRCTNIVNAIKGKRTGSNCIRTMAIFTAQNPDSKKATNSINRQNNRSLSHSLKSAGYVFIPCIGKWGTLENSYAIINISLDACKYYNGKFEQTGFVFCKFRTDGTLYSQYFEKMDVNSQYDRSHNNYIVKSDGVGYIDMCAENDNFTIIGKHFKFQIPFKEIQDINDRISENYQKIPTDNKCRTILEEVDFCMNRVGLPAYLHKKNLYFGL